MCGARWIATKPRRSSAEWTRGEIDWRRPFPVSLHSLSFPPLWKEGTTVGFKSSVAAGGQQQGTGRGASAIVDVVQRRRSDRVAKLTFITVWVVLAPTVTLVAATITDRWLAVLIGVAGALVVSSVAALVAFVWPVVRMVWYWAGEITAGVLLLAGYWALTRVVPWPVALLLLAVAAGLLVVRAGSRRRLAAWVWCAVSRHRLRTCFATFIRANRFGSLPLILWARPTLAGERVWVWLRPGLSLEDLTDSGGLDRLAVGCWAKTVKVVPGSRRWAPLLRVDITRREPLADTITSPIPDLLGDLPEVTDLPPTVASVDAGGLDLDDVPAPADAGMPAAGTPRPGSRRNGRPAPTPRRATDDDELSQWI